MQPCSCVIYLLRDQWMIKRLSKVIMMGVALVSNNFSPIPLIDEKKKWLVAAWNLQCIKTFLTLFELSQYCKSGCICSSSKPIVDRSDCSRLWNALCLCSPVRPAQVVPGAAQELGRWFCPLNLRLPSGTAFGEIARWPAGAQTWTQTWTLPPDQLVVTWKVLSPPKPQQNLWSLNSFEVRYWCQIWVKCSNFSNANAPDRHYPIWR